VKPTSPAEAYVYKTVRHERILKYFSTNYEGFLELEYHDNGDLWTYLIEHKPPLSTRVEWAVQIAEGLAHLHSHSIVWADPHFRNILVTDDLKIVLCDFAFSVSKPKLSHQFTTAPPPIFTAPFGFYGLPPTYVDVYGFGVMLFALLANRFPWTPDLVPSADVQLAAKAKLSPFPPGPEFDTLVPELHAHFGSILVKCFDPKYVLGSELLDDIKHARDSWLQVRASLTSISYTHPLSVSRSHDCLRDHTITCKCS
jgi:protein kinase X